MDNLEKVEKIREKTGASYEDAKEALEAAGGDVLDALVYLENAGRINKPEVQKYTTKAESSEEFKEASDNFAEDDVEDFGSIIKKFLKWCGKMIKKGCENFFVIKKHEEEIISAPVIVLILLLIAGFWIMVPLLIAGLFFGFRYSFKGNIAKSVDVNKACDKAAETCESIKQEFTKK